MGGRGRVAVIVPWRGGCPDRAAAWAWVQEQWWKAGYDPILGEHTTGPWCKAAAIEAGLAQTNADVLVLADADVWTAGVHEAIRQVREGAPWAVPHGLVYRLTEDATTQVLHGARPHPHMPLTHPVYTGWAGGGITVIQRALYTEAPIDRRFVGWGGEDEAAASAWMTLAGGPWRGADPLWHLYHPPQERVSRRWGSENAQHLATRYASALTPDQVRSIISEA